MPRPRKLIAVEKPVRPEHKVCMEFIEYLRTFGSEYEVDIIRVPNDSIGKRSKGRIKGMLTGEGWTVGYSDYIFARAIGQYFGLFLEAKADAGDKPSQAQYDFLMNKAAKGYASIAAYGSKAMISVFDQYVFNNGVIDYETPKTINFNKLYLYGGS